MTPDFTAWLDRTSAHRSKREGKGERATRRMPRCSVIEGHCTFACWRKSGLSFKGEQASTVDTDQFANQALNRSVKEDFCSVALAGAVADCSPLDDRVVDVTTSDDDGRLVDDLSRSA